MNTPRPQIEIASLTDALAGFAILADGMGGCNAGAWAAAARLPAKR